MAGGDRKKSDFYRLKRNCRGKIIFRMKVGTKKILENNSNYKTLHYVYLIRNDEFSDIKILKLWRHIDIETSLFRNTSKVMVTKIYSTSAYVNDSIMEEFR